MNHTILQKEVQEFIKTYKGDTPSLAFKGSPFEEITTQELIEQIEGFRKVEKKLSQWHQSPNIYYPKKINLEQCSSEITAQYKASLVSGTTLADITGGFGVDVFYFSFAFKQVDYYEQNESLSQIVEHNMASLGAKNVEVISGDGLEGIRDKAYDVIYTDPARRHKTKGKVFFLSDCEPNVVEHLDFLFDHCQILFIKTSPMLDITAATKELKHVREIHIVAVDNEVKELLWLLDKGYDGKTTVVTQNFSKGVSQHFQLSLDEDFPVSYGAPQKFLYEPNAALMKANNFGTLAHAYGIDKLHQHSHLFTSDAKVDFPGRVFEILEVLPYQKKVIKNNLQGLKAHVTTRNFSENVASLRKKWRITDGGDTYLFFTTNANNERIVLKCRKGD